MNRQEFGWIAILGGTWFTLLLEYIILDIEMSFYLSFIWGIATLLLFIKIMWKYAIVVTYE